MTPSTPARRGAPEGGAIGRVLPGTAEISGKVRRERGFGRDVMGRSGLGCCIYGLRPACFKLEPVTRVERGDSGMALTSFG
jgi:hypothetical protein